MTTLTPIATAEGVVSGEADVDCVVSSSSTSIAIFPWLKSCGSQIRNPPINPLHEFDTRLSVVDLIREHQTKIDLVRNELTNDPLFNKEKHDDLWILRFLLSHNKKVKEAVKASKTALVFRDSHQLDTTDIRYTTPLTGFAKEAIQQFATYCNDDALLFTLPDQQRGVVAFINLGSIRHHELVQNVSEDHWLPCFMYFSEWAFQWQDYITRKTGRITKSIRLIDASATKINGLNPELSRRDGKVMGIMEDCYPQLLQTIYICDAPNWVQIPWRILRTFFPKRVTSKIDFLAPKTNTKECERLLYHISIEHLPSKYGGTNEQWPVSFPLIEPKE